MYFFILIVLLLSEGWQLEKGWCSILYTFCNSILKNLSNDIHFNKYSNLTWTKNCTTEIKLNFYKFFFQISIKMNIYFFIKLHIQFLCVIHNMKPLSATFKAEFRCLMFFPFYVLCCNFFCIILLLLFTYSLHFCTPKPFKRYIFY